MAPTTSLEWSAEMNLYMIFTFNIGEAGFNGVSSSKPDIYFALGCVCLAASYLCSLTRSTFQNKPQVSLNFFFRPVLSWIDRSTVQVHIGLSVGLLLVFFVFFSNLLKW